MYHGYDLDLVPWQVLTSLWLAGVAAHSVRRLVAGDRQTIWFVQLVHVVFCGVPLWLDLVFAPPTYSWQYGFALSQFDRSTNTLYLAYIAGVPLLLHWSASLLRSPGEAGSASPPPVVRTSGSLRVASWCALLAVPLALLLAPDPGIYLSYASVLIRRETEARQFFVVLILVTNLATIGALLLLSDSTLSWLWRAVVVPFLVLALWLNGKRALVGIAAVLYLYLFWVRGTLRGPRLLLAGIAAVTTLFGFSVFYESAIRGRDVTALVGQSWSQSQAYADFRVDFGRDGGIKQTIFSELHPERLRVLDYRGQSLLFNLLFFVPRSVWPSKPFPYAVYATSAVLDIAVADIGWGVTTSWLDEAIANFSWLGMLLGPLVPGLVCAIGDRRRSSGARSLTLLVASLLLTVNLVAFMSIAVLWVGAMALSRPAAARLTAS